MKLLSVISLFSLIFLFAGCSKKDTATPKPPPDEPPVSKVPKVTTNDISDQNVYSTTLSGKILDSVGSKITEVGIVVDTVAQPTLTKNFNRFKITPDSAGNFFVIVTNIPRGTVFYVRAYAINSYGTGYGNQIVFGSLTPKTYFGNISLTSQQEVDDFGAENYSVIDGDLEIKGSSITSLAPLKSLVLIGSNLYIQYTSLTDLTGLDSLTESGYKLFGGDFWIENNSKLINFKGLSALRQIHGHVQIYANDVLSSMSGLDNLISVGLGNMTIMNCNKLINLNGLNKLQFIGADFWIGNNASLKTIKALSSLNYIAFKLFIFNNPSLINLDGLEKIQTLHDGLDLEDNKSLVDIKGISNLTSVDVASGDGYIKITNSPLLTDLSSLSNIKEATGIYLNNLPVKDLMCFKNLENVQGLELDGLNNLVDLSGLEKLTTVSRIIISNDNALINLKGLEGVSSLTDNYYSLGIANNNKLQSLEGLENITHAEGSIYITKNPSLSEFCALKPLFVAGFNNTFSASENSVNPDGNTIVVTCP